MWVSLDWFKKKKEAKKKNLSLVLVVLSLQGEEIKINREGLLRPLPYQSICFYLSSKGKDI
jgi:hypothetical protein